jgi:hypothetical protein
MFPPPSASDFRAVLKENPISLQGVISSANFWAEYQAENTELLDYLFDPETTSEIFDSIFVHQSLLSHTLMRILTAEYPFLLIRLSQNLMVVSKLQAFLQVENPKVIVPKLAGYFSAILGSVLQASDGAWASNLPGLIDFLINHHSTLAYRDLLLTLIRKYPSVVVFSPEFVDHVIATFCDESRAFSGLFLILTCIKVNSLLVSSLDRPPVIETLLELAASPRSPTIISFGALEVISQIALHTTEPDLRSIIQPFESKFTTIISNDDCRLGVLLSLFPDRILLHVDSFLTIPPPPPLAINFLRTVQSLCPASFCTLVESTSLVSKLIAQFAVSKTNGHVTELARVLNLRSFDCPQLETPEWRTFVVSMLVPHLQRLNRSYGGMCPSSRKTLKSCASLDNALGTDEVKMSEVMGPFIFRPTRGPGTWDSGMQSRMAAREFHYVAPAMTARSDGPNVNETELPSLSVAPAVFTRRHRARNMGSVSVDDIPILPRRG